MPANSVLYEQLVCDWKNQCLHGKLHWTWDLCSSLHPRPCLPQHSFMLNSQCAYTRMACCEVSLSVSLYQCLLHLWFFLSDLPSSVTGIRLHVWNIMVHICVAGRHLYMQQAGVWLPKLERKLCCNACQRWCSLRQK